MCECVGVSVCLAGVGEWCNWWRSQACSSMAVCMSTPLPALCLSLSTPALALTDCCCDCLSAFSGEYLMHFLLFLLINCSTLYLEVEQKYIMEAKHKAGVSFTTNIDEHCS